MKKIILSCILFISLNISFSQDLPRYNHYFNYSYLYNPAFLGSVTSSQLNMIYRKQWVGLEGAPEYIHAGLQLPLSEKVALGFNASNFEQGLIVETSAMGSMAYTINLSVNSTLSFGVSIGAGRTSLDISQLIDFSDPAIAGSLDKSFYMEGQAGLSLNLNRLNMSFSMPKIFEKNTFSDIDFQEVSLGPLNTTFSSISYRFEISPKVSFEPMGVYRMDNQLEDQWQAYATLYYNNILWLGGNYSDGYGSAAYAGFQVNDFIKIGYSFDFSSNDLSAYNSHEFYVSLRLGSKKIDRHKNYLAKEKPLPLVEPDTKDNIQEVIKEAKNEEEVVTPDENLNTSDNQSPIIQEKAPEIEEDPIVLDREPIVEIKDSVKEKPIEPEESEKTEVNSMKAGYYVVVGAFTHEENALKYISDLKTKNYEPQTAYNTRTQYHYVYLLFTKNYEEAQTLRNDLRKLSVIKFEEAWILNIK